MPYAGVLPFTTSPDGRRVFVLLGREAFGREKGRWAGFGGGMAPFDASLEDTAAREAYEESIGLLGTADSIRTALLSSATRYDISNGAHFLLPVGIQLCWPFSFQGVRHAVRQIVGNRYSAFLEKDMLDWVDIDALNDPRSNIILREMFARDIARLVPAIRQVASRAKTAADALDSSTAEPEWTFAKRR